MHAVLSLPAYLHSTLIRSTDSSMSLTRKRKFKRLNSSFFIEVRSLKGVVSFFLGLTNNISYEGFSFTFQNFALEPRQRLQFKLIHHRTKSIIYFHGDVIWQEQKDMKCSAGVRFCDYKEKIHKIMLEVISDICNIPVNSLLTSNDTGELSELQ